MTDNSYRGFLLTAMLVVLLIGVCFVMIPEMGKMPRSLPYRKLIKATFPITDPQKPYSYGSMKQDLKNIQDYYSGRIKLSTIGRSFLKRDIYLVKLGKGPRKILIVGGIYGPELRTSMLLVKAITEYASAGELLKSDKENPLNLFEKNTVHWVPMLNPDGAEIAVRGTKAGGNNRLLLQANEGKKDFDRWRSNARGVNLNIQYPYQWKRAWSLDAPHYKDYKGPRPESERESKAIANLIRKEKYRLLIIYHSDGKVIFWNSGQKKAQYGHEMAIARGVSQITGNPLVHGKSGPTRGCLKDWFMQQFKQPAITIE